MTQPLILIAASGLAREVLAALEASPTYHVIGIVDDNAELFDQPVGGKPILGPLDVITAYPEAKLLICVGHGIGRERIRRRLVDLGIDDQRFATVVDPTVRIPSTARIGVGSIVLAGTVLTADIRLGRHVVIMPNVTLTHDDRIDDFVSVCAGVSLGGSVHVGRGAYLGMGSCVQENLTVGEEATVGMGAVAIRSVPPSTTVAGVPARTIGHREPARPGSVQPRPEMQDL